MAALTPSMESLVAEFGKLPGIGRKTALRLAMFILTEGQERALSLSSALKEVILRSRFCERCANLCEDDLCQICTNSHRDQKIVCVVEQLNDLMAIERAGDYRGVYHILGGFLSPLDGVSPGDLRIKQLLKRVEDGELQEVILATNSTVEGDATALYLIKELESTAVKISRLARGVPIGGNLDYIDQLTLASAINSRERLR
jgi:recombination protein RecR